MAIAGQPAKEVTAKKRSPTKQRRVVVTGMGVETPVGDNPDVFYSNLLERVSGISEIEAFDCAHFPMGWMGPNYSISTACATSNFCILNAANHIIRGETDMMLCGGSDAAIIPIEFLGGSFTCDAYHVTEPYPEEKWHSGLAPINGSIANAPGNFQKATVAGEKPSHRPSKKATIAGKLSGLA
ncbi:fatty acid biosynthesis 1 [Actinidia rufa]|uniref:beta-ketoacyl-[acyl-carrier-protein] synthase I n=1 Tax=Actinidia rufa TaxID=165716 RepID=A0A7J0D9D5_9ERIC|nr:fatty acid biosynthesis 1 [Actinidia rufa]